MTSRRWILAALGLSAACLFLAAVVLATSFVILASRRTASATVTLPTWRDPTKVDALKIDAPSAMAVLAGTAEPQAINTMLGRGETDAAYAATIYSTSLSDRQRVGELIVVGERYTAANNAAQAKQTYQALMDTLALSPALSDYERAQAMSQAANARTLPGSIGWPRRSSFVHT